MKRVALMTVLMLFPMIVFSQRDTVAITFEYEFLRDSVIIAHKGNILYNGIIENIYHGEGSVAKEVELFFDNTDYVPLTIHFYRIKNLSYFEKMKDDSKEWIGINVIYPPKDSIIYMPPKETKINVFLKKNEKYIYLHTAPYWSKNTVEEMNDGIRNSTIIFEIANVKRNYCGSE